MCKRRRRSPFATCAILSRSGAGRWGALTQRRRSSGLYTGRSLIDGGKAWFRIDADPARLMIDYLVGTPTSWSAASRSAVVPGAELDLPATTCLVSLIAWRSAGTSNDDWGRTKALHEAEIILIAGQIEGIVDKPPTQP